MSLVLQSCGESHEGQLDWHSEFDVAVLWEVVLGSVRSAQ